MVRHRAWATASPASAAISKPRSAASVTRSIRPLTIPSMAVPASSRAWTGERSAASRSRARAKKSRPSGDWPRRSYWRAMAAARRRPRAARLAGGDRPQCNAALMLSWSLSSSCRHRSWSVSRPGSACSASVR